MDIFSELDPLGTGSKKPYIDKKDFFQHLKNPPKKILKDLAITNSEDTFPTNFKQINSSKELESIEEAKAMLDKGDAKKFVDDEFADFDKFKDKETSAADRINSPRTNYKESKRRLMQQQSLSVSLPPEEIPALKTSYGNPLSNSMSISKYEKEEPPVRLPSPKRYAYSSRRSEFSEYSGNKSQSTDRSFPVDFASTSDSPASPLRSCSSGANSRLSSSSAELENVPDPPPRGVGSILINPPPLPPKKYGNRTGIKPPPRPPHGDGHFHYDFLEREEGSPSPTRRSRESNSPKSRGRFDDNFSPPLPQLPKRADTSSTFSNSSFEDSFNSIIQSPSMMTDNTTNKPEINLSNFTKDITLSQLTSTFLTDLADNLGMSVSDVTSLTLAQLTECIESLAKKENNLEDNKPIFSSVNSNRSCNFNSNVDSKSYGSKVGDVSFTSNEPLFKATFDDDSKPENSNSYDKYAVFRELLDMEQMKSELKPQKFSEEEEEPINSENHDESREDDAQSDDIDDTIVSLANLTVELPPASDEQVKESLTYYEMRSNTEDSDSPKYKEMTPLEETEPEEPTFEKEILQKNDSPLDVLQNNSEDVDRFNTSDSLDEIKQDDESRDSDNFVITAEEVNELSKIIDKKDDVHHSKLSSNDRYAALREIIEETEQPVMEMNFIATNNTPKSSTEADLHEIFSDNFNQQPTSISTSNDQDMKATVMDIFEEIKHLNSETHRPKQSKVSSDLDSVFDSFADKKEPKDVTSDSENWAKFEPNSIYSSEKLSGEGQDKSVSGASPWSPEDRELTREPSIKRNVHRNSGGSDNEWKDDESEESNGRVKREGPCCARHPRYDLPPFEERSFYEEAIDEEKDHTFREKMCRKTRGTPWIKGSHRSRDPMTWHEESRWDEERRRLPPRKPYMDEEEFKAYWKHRAKQRPWNGEREGYWGPEHPFYEEEMKRRMGSWTEEEREGRERFSSQESMAYEEDDRWYRREYDRRRYEDESAYYRNRGPESDYVSRDTYKKHEPRYFREGRDRHYDYPPWEEDYEPKRPEDSPRYLSRKKHWPKRPNSANEGREMLYMDPRQKCAMSRSECSDNDSDPYHRPYRSRSRDSYWESDQEFDSWGERLYWSEGPETKGESLHRRRMNRQRGRIQTKPQNSQFEDDFTQSLERPEVSIDPINIESRIRPDIDIKQSASPRSPRSAKDTGKRDLKSHKSSSYFDDDLTPTASASSDASDRQRIGSDLKVTPEEVPSDTKDSNLDKFASEDAGKDSFFNGDPSFDDDAFTFRSELEDQVPERTVTIPMKNSRLLKYHNNRAKSDQYVKKSDSVNIFSRDNDPFDDDEFFN